MTAHAVMNQHHLLEGLLFYLEEEAQAVESPDSQFVSSLCSGNKHDTDRPIPFWCGIPHRHWRPIRIWQQGLSVNQLPK